MTGLDAELDSYLRQAWERNDILYEPPAHGNPFRSPMFEFVRAAKAHPKLGQKDGLKAAQCVEKYLLAWGPSTGTDLWGARFTQSDDPRTEFIDTWDKIKWPMGVVEQAVQGAAILPLKPIRSYSPDYERFISIAGHLQRNVEGPILLPCRKFAGILNCEPTSISRYRNRAIQDAILRLEQRGRKSHREADEFRFVTEKFDWTNGHEIHSENLSICVTPGGPACYTDTQDTQITKDTERQKDSQDSHDSKDLQDLEGAQPTKWPERVSGIKPKEVPKVSVKRSVCIPTTEELLEQLQGSSRAWKY